MDLFAFSEETRKEPTQFEVLFRTKVAEYRYILHVRQEIVAYESLDRIKLDTGRRSALFVRNDNEVDLKGGLNYGNPRQELRTAIAKTDDVKKLVLDMIREMDLDIEDFRIEEKDENHIEVYTRHIVNGYSTELSLSEEFGGTKNRSNYCLLL